MEKLGILGKILSVLADILTILGIGGIASWSVFGKRAGSFQQVVADILSYSLKTAFCLILLLVFLVSAQLPFISIVVLVNGHSSYNTRYWNATEPLGYVVAYLITGLAMGSAFILICQSIYSWSFEPFRRVGRAFRSKQGTEDSK